MEDIKYQNSSLMVLIKVFSLHDHFYAMEIYDKKNGLFLNFGTQFTHRIYFHIVSLLSLNTKCFFFKHLY